MIIQNQPSVYQYNESFLYNVRVKGHYEENWTQLYLNDQIPLANSNSAQTILTMGPLSENGLTLAGSSTVIPYRGMEDFPIQAMIGGFYKTGFDHTEFYGESSGWSNTQTLIITETTPTLVPSISPSPTTPSDSSLTPIPTGPQTIMFFGLDWVGVAVVVLLVAVVISLVVVVFLRRRR